MSLTPVVRAIRARPNAADAVLVVLFAVLAGCGEQFGAVADTAPPADAAEAEIEVDAGSVIGEIDPKVYGHFIEHLGLCVYGGVWEDNPKVPTVHGGIRSDVAELVKAIRPPILRWPGGSFADGYHWVDGIGPVRPVRPNLAWQAANVIDPRIGAPDPNTFGTDEFIALVRELQTEPYINTNFGTGTPQEAAAWVAYTNAPTSSTVAIGVDAHGVDWGDAGHWARAREKNGSAEPYGVEYWGIGNEICGSHELGYTDAVSYANGLIEFHVRMTAVDPRIKLLAVGCDEQWNEDLLRIAGRYFDYLTVHEYYPGITSDTILRPVGDSERHYYSILAAPALLSRRIDAAARTVHTVLGSESSVKIAMDEWNLWWGGRQLVHTDYSLRDGLFAALAFMEFHRAARVLGMANLAQMVNALGMLNTSETEVVSSPIYHAFKLYRDHARELAVNARTVVDTYESERLGNIPTFPAVPYLESSATVDKEKRTAALIVVNRHYDRPLKTKIALTHMPGGAPTFQMDAWELNGAGPNDRNTFEEKTRVRIEHTASGRVASSFIYSFPPHSATALVLRRN